MDGRVIRAVVVATFRDKCLEATRRNVDIDNTAPVNMARSSDSNPASEEAAPSDQASGEAHGSGT